MNPFAPDELFDLSGYAHKELFQGVENAWEALARLQAYLRDSILGNRVNLGAGTKLANLKVIEGTVDVVSPQGRSVSTGLRKLGAILGDDVEIGCNAVSSPGTVIGRKTLVYPCASVRGT